MTWRGACWILALLLDEMVIIGARDDGRAQTMGRLGFFMQMAEAGDDGEKQPRSVAGQASVRSDQPRTCPASGEPGS